MLRVAPQRRRRILHLAAPIIGGMVSQNVMNLVDTAMVGTLGDAALAGLGQANFLNFMAAAFITGASAGVQAMAARRVGEGREEQAAAGLNAGLLLILAVSIPWTALLIRFAPQWMVLFNTDPRVLAEGIPYLQARLVATAAVGTNFAFRGFWNGINCPRLYMRTLIVMHASNIVLSYLLIFGKLGLPRMGSLGAGIGTAAATWIGTAYYFFLGLRHARPNGFLRERPTGEAVRTILRLSVPAGLNQFFFSAGMSLFFAIVGRVGTAELAATNVMINLLLVVYLVEMGFGLAAASLVGQALGRKEVTEAAEWGWDTARIATALVCVLSAIGLLFPERLLGLFLHDPDTLRLARMPMRLVSAMLPLDAVGMILSQAHFGAGDSKAVMRITLLLQWGFFLPAAWIAGPRLGWGMMGIWGVHVLWRLLHSGLYALRWQRRAWAAVAV